MTQNSQRDKYGTSPLLSPGVLSCPVSPSWGRLCLPNLTWLLLAASILSAAVLLFCFLIGPEDTELMVPEEVTEDITEVDGSMVVSCVLHFYYTAMEGGLVTIFQIIFVCFLFKVITLPYGRLTWVGGYDHN